MTEIELPSLIDRSEEWQSIIDYLSKYPTFYFRSSTLSNRLCEFGVMLSPQKLSKILLKMHNIGLLDKRTSGNGINIKAYYKIKK